MEAMDDMEATVVVSVEHLVCTAQEGIACFC